MHEIDAQRMPRCNKGLLSPSTLTIEGWLLDLQGSQEVAAPGSGGPREHDGPQGPEPTRYGDWSQKGRCTDF